MPWTVACQVPISMGFSRQENWSGLPFPSPGDLPNPGIKPGSAALEVDSLMTKLTGVSNNIVIYGAHFIIVDWNAKVGNQEIPGVTGKFGLGVQTEAGQRLTEFCQENLLVIANTLYQKHKRGLST